MQVSEYLGYKVPRKVLSWLVRTPITDQESYNEARDRMLKHATELGIRVHFLRGKGQRYQTPRYHLWELHDETDAMQFYLTFGDLIKPQQHRTFN